MRIVLHIGQQNTGSTALQCALAKAHDRLLDCGVLFPRSCHSMLGISDFGSRFEANTVARSPWREPEPVFHYFRKKLEYRIAQTQPELLVLSTEKFFRPLIPGPMCAWLRTHACEIVAYIRHGDPRGVLESYMAAFGRDCVTALPYDPADTVANFSGRYLPLTLTGTRENVTS